MSIENKKRNIAARIIFHAAKWPFIYLIIGIVLIVFSYLDELMVPFVQWKNFSPLINKIGNIFIVLGVLTFIYKVIVLVCWHIEKNLDSKHKVSTIVLASFRKGLRIIFILIAINIIISILNPSEFYLNLSNNIINTIIIGSIGWFVIQIFYTIDAMLYQQMTRLAYPDNFRQKALYTKMHIIRNIATVIIIIITIAAILMSYSSVRSIGISLLASAGFLTALVGLAAQKTLFSVFSGLQIALAQTIKIGDIIVIENTTGTIEEITFTYVIIKLSDRRRVVLPINYFIEKPFENWSQDGSSLRSSFNFSIDFMMPLAPLRKEFDTILQNSPYWDGTIKKLQVAKITDRAVEINIQVSAATTDNLSELCAEVQEKMLAFVQNNYADFFPKVNLPNT